MMIWLNRFFFEFWWNRIELKISKFTKKNNVTIDFSLNWHNVSNVKFVKNELLNETIDSKNVKNSNICFDRIANETKNDELIVDIFIDSHVDLIVSIKKCELTTNFFACCSRLCWRNIFLKLNVCLQYRHVDNFFVDFEINSNAIIRKSELNIVLKIDEKNAFVKTISNFRKKLKFDWFSNYVLTKS